MRIDRFLAVNLLHPFRRDRSARLGWVEKDKRGQRIPILMFHSVSDDLEPGIGPYYRTVTSPLRFLEQMSFLKSRGWRGVSLNEALSPTESIANGVKLFVITFDDGFRDFLVSAMPVLRSQGFGATVFLATAFQSSR